MFPTDRRDMARTSVVVEMCETAAWLTDSDTTDRRARARLLAIRLHRFNNCVLGAWLPVDVLAQDAAEVAADLAALDDRPALDRGAFRGDEARTAGAAGDDPRQS